MPGLNVLEIALLSKQGNNFTQYHSLFCTSRCFIASTISPWCTSAIYIWSNGAHHFTMTKLSMKISRDVLSI